MSGARSGQQGRFPKTRWSLVAETRERGDARGRQALSDLCVIYWPPLYVFVRRSGYSVHDAEDLTQAFFERVISGDYFDRADAEKGKMRSFLLLLLKRFLKDQRDRETALKRGRGEVLLRIDQAEAENLLKAGGGGETPAEHYERQWALATMRAALEETRVSYEQSGKGAQFDALKGFVLRGDEDRPHGELADELGTSAGAVKVAIHRLRKHYQEKLMATVMDTVESRAEAMEELRYMARLFAESEPGVPGV